MQPTGAFFVVVALVATGCVRQAEPASDPTPEPTIAFHVGVNVLSTEPARFLNWTEMGPANRSALLEPLFQQADANPYGAAGTVANQTEWESARDGLSSEWTTRFNELPPPNEPFAIRYADRYYNVAFVTSS